MPNIPTSPCVSFNLPTPSLPAIFSTAGTTITIPIPNIPTGLIPCCKLVIPAFTPAIPLPPLPIGPLVTALNALIQAGIAALPNVQLPSCPL